ncbi:hypothetical protein J1N35_045709 [Gossypium stocksii]|uniref:Uncharacterized protein n=1 Tax=Gossypium stocksii TaxID=47602 RepID=A0A9D3UBT6_9ROSI|nr:hypothetical protein J1N35_045709 [Gossypium stocksii]
MPELLRSAKLAVEKGMAQGRNETYVKQLSDYIIPALVEALHKEPDTEICASMLDALNECVQISGPLLDESQVRSTVDEIKQVITAGVSRKSERAERAKAEDFDAEEGELIKEENEQEEEVFDQVGEILGTLIKTFKASFLPFFDELSSYLTPMWGKDKTPEERRIAICIFDDVAEQCREAALKSDNEVLGPNHNFLPKIDSSKHKEQTASRMVNLLRQLQQTLPPAALASTLSSLQPQQQPALSYFVICTMCMH